MFKLHGNIYLFLVSTLIPFSEFAVNWRYSTTNNSTKTPEKISQGLPSHISIPNFVWATTCPSFAASSSRFVLLSHSGHVSQTFRAWRSHCVTGIFHFGGMEKRSSKRTAGRSTSCLCVNLLSCVFVGVLLGERTVNDTCVRGEESISVGFDVKFYKSCQVGVWVQVLSCLKASSLYIVTWLLAEALGDIPRFTVFRSKGPIGWGASPSNPPSNGMKNEIKNPALRGVWKWINCMIAEIKPPFRTPRVVQEFFRSTGLRVAYFPWAREDMAFNKLLRMTSGILRR